MVGRVLEWSEGILESRYCHFVLGQLSTFYCLATHSTLPFNLYHVCRKLCLSCHSLYVLPPPHQNMLQWQRWCWNDVIWWQSVTGSLINNQFKLDFSVYNCCVNLKSLARKEIVCYTVVFNRMHFITSANIVNWQTD